jgi:ribosome-binding factor A
MQAKTSRPKRTMQVGGLIQKEISELLIRKIKDPRLEMVTITGVKVSPDLKLARVYFSRFGNPEEIRQGLEGLQSAAGFIKRELGQRLKLRHVPDLEFSHDTSFEYGDRIESLLKGLFPAKGPVES